MGSHIVLVVLAILTAIYVASQSQNTFLTLQQICHCLLKYVVIGGGSYLELLYLICMGI